MWITTVSDCVVGQVVRRCSWWIPARSSSTPRPRRSIDVTAAQMLADLAHNLRSRGTRMLVARDVGQVRDVLRRVEVPEIVVGVYPTVDAAVEAALGGVGEIGAADPNAPPMDDSGTPDAPAAPDTRRTGHRRRHGGGWARCGVRLNEGRDALSMIHL